MIKFYKQEEQLNEYQDKVINLESFDSPLKEIIEKGELADYSFEIDGEKLMLGDCFTLLINVKGSSSVYAIFKKEGFEGEQVVERISKLKKMEITDSEKAQDKTLLLFYILKDYKPCFVIYVHKGQYGLSINEVKELTEGLNVFYAVQKEEVTEEQEEAPSKKVVKSGKKFDFSVIKTFFKESLAFIKSHHLHFIFLTVATFLFGFAFGIGLGNAIVKNGIAAILFVFSGFGFFLNSFVYYDYFKKHQLKDKNIALSTFFNVLGAIISIAAIASFYALDNSGVKNGITLGKLILISVFVTIGISAVTLFIGYFIRLFVNKKSRN